IHRQARNAATTIGIFKQVTTTTSWTKNIHQDSRLGQRAWPYSTRLPARLDARDTGALRPGGGLHTVGRRPVRRMQTHPFIARRTDFLDLFNDVLMNLFVL